MKQFRTVHMVLVWTTLTSKWNFTKIKFRSLPIIKILIECWLWLIFICKISTLMQGFGLGSWRKKSSRYWLRPVKLRPEMNQRHSNFGDFLDTENFDEKRKKTDSLKKSSSWTNNVLVDTLMKKNLASSYKKSLAWVFTDSILLWIFQNVQNLMKSSYSRILHQTFVLEVGLLVGSNKMVEDVTFVVKEKWGLEFSDKSIWTDFMWNFVLSG